uniref:Uncharacterized protein n=1 Tax=Rhizophora mucronata TaxID=61149 RepID=A0A2P2NNI1_RHIMU
MKGRNAVTCCKVSRNCSICAERIKRKRSNEQTGRTQI